MSQASLPPNDGDRHPRTKAQLAADIRRHQRSALVVNCHSRRGRRLFSEAHRRLTSEGFNLAFTVPVADPARLADTLAEAIRQDIDLLIVGGGDGTLSEATKHLARRDICLGVLPLGTTNNFARSLGIPPGLPRAIRTLTHGKVADVDLGRVDDHLFANLTSLGVSVQVAGHVRPAMKRALGRLAYGLTALRMLPGHRPFRARITVGDQLFEFETHQLNIANGSFHAGRQIAHDASIDDRLLVVYQLGTSRRAHLLAATLRHVVAGPRYAITDRPFLTARELSLETDPPQLLDVDGEIHGRTPVRVAVEPQALRVMVPQDFVDT